MIIRSVALVLTLCSFTANSQNPDAEVHIFSYDVLRPEEFYRFRNAYYAFEVCICNRPSRDPKLSRFCTCNDLKGKTVRDGAIDNTERCLEDKNAWGCMNAALPYFDKESPIYYIRISANGIVLTHPGWQELTQGDGSTTTMSLPSTYEKDIRITFSITEHLQKWNNNAATTTTTLAPTRPPKYHKERKNRPWFLMTSTVAPFWTRMRTSTRPPTTTTTTTTVAPWREEKTDWRGNDIDNGFSTTQDFTFISNMWELRNYLYMESLKDRIPAWQLNIQEYKNEIIAQHNAMRALHGAGPLEYDPYLESEGQRWANYLGARASCTAHDPNRRHGECLFYFGGQILPNAKTLAALTTQSFYLERNNYDYDNYRPVFFYRTGHFTQLVWRASQRIGVGVYIGLASGGGAPCRPWAPTYQLFVVVKYDPPGNVQSSYAYKRNVFPRMY